MLRVAVIGAGMAGLSCASRLAAAGARVDVFEKTRSTGGRLHTPRDGEVVAGYDGGAQYFTVRDARFAEQVQAWERIGAVARWETSPGLLDAAGRLLASPDNVERWVGTPLMASLTQQLAGRDLLLCTQADIEAVERRDGQWTLHAGRTLHWSGYDALVVAVPAPQALRFLHASPTLESAARAAVFEPCWSVALGFDAPLGIKHDAIFARGQPVNWLARDSRKPGRQSRHETWVLHAAPAWSEERLDAPPEAVARHLLRWLLSTFGLGEREAAWMQAHCWRFARTVHAVPELHRLDAVLQLGICGDWCGGGRVEGAWLSGRALADRLLAGQNL